MAAHAAGITAGSSAVSGLSGTLGGLATQLQNNSALDAYADFRGRMAEREAQERLRLGEQEFEEAIRLATELRGEATELEAIGLRNAQAIRAEGERIVGAVRLRNAAQGVDAGGSAAEVAAAAVGAAEFAASEEIKEASRAADSLLFEAKETDRAGRERRRAGVIGAESARLLGQFEADSLRFGKQSSLSILSGSLKSLQSLPTAVNETLEAFKAGREAREIEDIKIGVGNPLGF